MGSRHVDVSRHFPNKFELTTCVQHGASHEYSSKGLSEFSGVLQRIINNRWV